MSRTYFILAAGLCGLIFSPADACTLNEIQKSDMRTGFCRQAIGVAPSLGCTRLVMRAQVADQLKQIALARRCGYNAEAEKLESFYKSTTPIIIKLYECVDQPMEQANVEQLAKQDTDKDLTSLSPGCPTDLKAKLAVRLPKLIAVDQKALRDAREIASQIGLNGP